MLTYSPRHSLDWDRLQRWRHSACLPQGCAHDYAALRASISCFPSPTIAVSTLDTELDDRLEAATTTTPCLRKASLLTSPNTTTDCLPTASLPPQDVNAAFWWHTTGATLLRLLHWAHYPSEAVERHARLIRDIVSPALGPAPQFDAASGDVLPAFESFMCDDHSPVEYGITWTDGKPCIRFSIEAIGTAHEIAANHGLNNSASWRLMEQLEDQGYGEFTAFKQLLSDATLQRVRHEGDVERIAGSPLRSQIFVAFDLRHDGQAMVKAYLMPHLRALQAGTRNFQVMRQALTAANLDCGALDRIAEYIGGHTGLDERRRPEAAILSTDAIADGAKARTKLYFRYPTSSFDEIVQHLSLGGVLPQECWSDPLRQLWKRLFRNDPLSGAATLPDTSSKLTGGCLIYYDFLPGAVLPTAKVYLPVRHWAPSDACVAEGLAELVSSSDSAGSDYVSALECIHPNADLASSRGRQNYVCLGQKKGGRFELSAYIGPMLFGQL